jgi:chromate transporter
MFVHVPQAPVKPVRPQDRVVKPLELFIAFAKLTLHSFGGALFWSRRMLVERQRWLSEQEFIELLALAQMLPGANGINLAVIVGYRFAGVAGAAAAAAGFLGAPLLTVIGIAMVHQSYGGLPLVHDALSGMSAVAVGLLLAVAAKMCAVLQLRWRPWLFVALTFLGVGVLRWPLLVVVGALAPVAIASAWKERH